MPSVTAEAPVNGLQKKAMKVLLVDLNNFAHYPTLSVGYLAAICRKAEIQVELFLPLMIGLKGFRREKPPKWWSFVFQVANYRAATSRVMAIRQLRAWAAKRQASDLSKDADKLLQGFRRRLEAVQPDIVMVSSYLMYRESTARICLLCKAAGVPVLVGGPYFAQPEIAEEWANIEGATALIGGEVEPEVPAILEAVHNRRDLSSFAGVWSRTDNGRAKGTIRPPLRALNDIPFPDYQDFPWERYPNRIVPIITGRGCGWGVCAFCSDVVSTAGRTFRSRSPQNVLDEISHHYRTYGVSLFVFTDLKLNSDLAVWHAIIDNMQKIAPGSRWVAAVHVDSLRSHRSSNGLSPDELRRAAASGCVRLSTGLESGSQRVLDTMTKGARIDVTSQYLKDAAEAGISTRCTMILGYPTETAQDVDETVQFLEAHRGDIERISLGRFHIVQGTVLHRSVEKRPEAFPGLSIIHEDPSRAWIEHSFAPPHLKDYRNSVTRLLRVVHKINSNPLKEVARDFEGVM